MTFQLIFNGALKSCLQLEKKNSNIKKQRTEQNQGFELCFFVLKASEKNAKN